MNMPHGHQEGWAPERDRPVRRRASARRQAAGEDPRPEITDGQAVAKVKAKTKLTSASLVYTTETGPINKRQWQTVPAQIERIASSRKRRPRGHDLVLHSHRRRGAATSSELVFGARP